MTERRFPPPWSVEEQGVSNKRRMWPPGQQQHQQPDRDSQAFTDRRLPKGHHDEPPEPNDRNHKPKALPERNCKSRVLGCFVPHIHDEQKLAWPYEQLMPALRGSRLQLRRQKSAIAAPKISFDTF